MKAFLSIFVCLALLVSGFALAEPAAEPVSKQMVVDNIKVRVGTDEYELPLKANFGFAVSEDGMLFDMGLDYNSDTLFPIQMKLTQDSFSMLIGKSSTAYAFASAILDSAGADWNQVTDLFSSMSSAMDNSIRYDEETVNAVTELLDKTFSAPEEDATYAGQPAKKRTGTLDSETTLALIDELMNTCAPEYSKYMFEYINFLNGLSYTDSIYVDDDSSDALTNYVTKDDAVPEDAFDSISAFLNALGAEITCDYDLISTESGAGKEDYVFHFTLTDEEGEIAIPLTVISEDAEHATVESVFSLEADGEKIDFSLAGTIDAGTSNFAFTAASNTGDTASIAVNTIAHDDSSITSNMAFDVSGMEDDETPLELHYTISGTSDTHYNGNYEYAFSIVSGDVDVGVSFSVAMQDGEVEDRIASAKEKLYSTEEDLTNGGSMLLMRIASLAGDVETLMNDPTIADLSDAFSALTPSYDPDVEYVPDTVDDLPFKLPEFTVLPEGFELVGESYYGFDDPAFGSATLRYDLPSDEEDSAVYASSGISITIRGPEETSTEFTLDADGKLVATANPTVESPKIMTYSSVYYTVEFSHENLSYLITVYDNALPLEDLPAFLSGIVWAE